MGETVFLYVGYGENPARRFLDIIAALIALLVSAFTGTALPGRSVTKQRIF